MQGIMHFLHVLAAIVVLGLSIASYFYLTITYRRDFLISYFTLILTGLIDAAVILPLVVFVIFTGFFLSVPPNLFFSIGWIYSSIVHTKLAIVTILINLLLKIRYYRAWKQQQWFQLSWLYHLANVLTIFFLLLIIHDMIFRKQLLPIFLGN